MSDQSNAYEAHRRLLDLLAGWEEFIEASNQLDMSEADEVAELYQAAGSMDDSSLANIEEFVRTKVLPLILNGVKS